MAVAIDGAFDERGLLFALAYLAIRVLGILVYRVGLRGDPIHQRAILTFAPVSAIAMGLVLAGPWSMTRPPPGCGWPPSSLRSGPGSPPAAATF